VEIGINGPGILGVKGSPGSTKNFLKYFLENNKKLYHIR
jgi:hypothetical protein